MRTFFYVLAVALISACTTTNKIPSTIPTKALFHDELFKPASIVIKPEDALAMTEPMLDYVRVKLHHTLGHVNNKDQRLALVDALYRKGELKLDYYAETTLTASEAFDAKKGNCLSLVLLTAAMAKKMGLPMHYQSVVGMTDWAQSEDFFVSIGHVNLVLDDVPKEFELTTWSAYPVIVDFTPPDQASVLDVRTIDEQTVLAMYLNNRAVETLILGNIDDAYWWAKASVQEDPGLINSYVTLGVIYRSLHHPEIAESVLELVAS